VHTPQVFDMLNVFVQLNRQTKPNQKQNQVKIKGIKTNKQSIVFFMHLKNIS
jgi:hypothetical protein